MSSVILALIFAGLSASMAWQSGKRGWGYLKMGRDFMETNSTQDTGRTLLFAGSLWVFGAFISLSVTVILLMVAVYYGTSV
jgi:hypothetical protein